MIKGSLKLLSGNDQLMLQTLHQSFGLAEWTVVPVDEKQFANPVKFVRILRHEKVQVLAFGCKDLVQQRFQFWISVFLCLGGASHKLILDETGRSKKIGIFRFVLIDVPRFCFEIIMSLWVLVRAWNQLAITHPSSSIGSNHD